MGAMLDTYELGEFQMRQGGEELEKGVLQLMHVEESTTIPEPSKQAIYAMASRGFALSSGDEVRTSVQGAAPHSFFRTTEVYAL